MSSDSTCRVGALPPELFDKIILELDSVRDLGNFITAARFVYRRFESQKSAILFRVLQNELGPVLTDARFLSLLPYADPRDVLRYHDHIHTMAAVYRDMQLGVGGHGTSRDSRPTIGELTALCRMLHWVNFLSEAYVEALLRSFQEGGDAGSQLSVNHTVPRAAAAPLSRTERLRVVRAFYRLQIVSNAWAATRRPAFWTSEDAAAISNPSDHQGVRRGLFAAWDPWELQQIDHAEVFITQLCVALVHRARDDDTERPIPKTGFADLYAHLDRLVQYMKTHANLADAALRDLSSRTEPPGRDALYREYVYPYQLLPLIFAFQSYRSQTLPDPLGDTREQEGEAIHFVDDHLQGTPFGWVDALNGRYVNWFGEALSSIPWLLAQSEESSVARQDASYLWRRSGFALWDKQRVDSLKKMNGFRSVRTGWVLET